MNKKDWIEDYTQIPGSYVLFMFVLALILMLLSPINLFSSFSLLFADEEPFFDAPQESGMSNTFNELLNEGGPHYE